MDIFHESLCTPFSHVNFCIMPLLLATETELWWSEESNLISPNLRSAEEMTDVNKYLSINNLFSLLSARTAARPPPSMLVRWLCSVPAVCYFTWFTPVFKVINLQLFFYFYSSLLSTARDNFCTHGSCQCDRLLLFSDLIWLNSLEPVRLGAVHGGNDDTCCCIRCGASSSVKERTLKITSDDETSVAGGSHSEM